LSKRVLLIVHSAGIGGGTRSLTVILEDLIAVGCSVHVIAPKGPMNDRWRELGASISHWKPPTCAWLGAPTYSSGVVYFSARHLVRLALLPWRWLKAVWVIRRLIITKDIDVVHVNSLILFPIAVALSAFCRSRGIRVVWHLREVLNQKLFWPLRLAIVKSIRFSSNAIIAITSNEAKAFQYSDGLQVIHNTVPESWLHGTESSGQPRNAPIVVAMGCQFSPGKGVPDFIEMARVLGSRYPDVMFELYTGRPRLRGAFADLLSATGCSLSECILNPHVRLLFDRQLTSKEYARFTVYVRADRAGCPWGRDVIEAMCSGVPVIATGSSQEFVAEGETGFLVPAGMPNRLAEAVERVLGNPDLRAAMSQAARRRAFELFSPDVHRKAIVHAFGLDVSDNQVLKSVPTVCHKS
jgi:glycosyltransferase involved in cell wall biosynthesis